MWTVRRNGAFYEVVTPEGQVRCKVKDYFFALSIAGECEVDRAAHMKQQLQKQAKEVQNA